MTVRRREVFLEVFNKVIGFFLKAFSLGRTATFASLSFVVGLFLPIMPKRFACGRSAATTGFWFGASSFFPIMTERIPSVSPHSVQVFGSVHVASTHLWACPQPDTVRAIRKQHSNAVILFIVLPFIRFFTELD